MEQLNTTSLLKAESAAASCSWQYPAELRVSLGMETPQPAQPMPASSHPQRFFFPSSLNETSCISVYADFPLSCHCAHYEPRSVIFICPYRVFILIGRISPGLLCWKLNSCSSLSLSLSVRLQAFNHLHSPSLDLLQYVHAFLRAENWTKHSQRVSPALRIRQRSPPLICWHVAFFTTGTLLVHSQLCSPGSPGPFPQN